MSDENKIWIFADIDGTVVAGRFAPDEDTKRFEKLPVDMAVVRAYVGNGFIKQAYLSQAEKIYRRVMEGNVSVPQAASEFYTMIAEAKAGKIYSDAVEIIRTKVVPTLTLNPRMNYVLNKGVWPNKDRVILSPVTFNWKETVDAMRDIIPFDMRGVYNEQEVDEEGRFVKGFSKPVAGDKTIAFGQFVMDSGMSMTYTIGLGDDMQQDGWVMSTRFPYIFAKDPQAAGEVLRRKQPANEPEFRKFFSEDLRTLLEGISHA